MTIKDNKKGNVKISTMIYTFLVVSGIIISMVFLYSDTLVRYDINKGNETNELVSQSNATIRTLDNLSRELNNKLLANPTLDQSQDSQNNMIASSFVALRRTPAILSAGFGLISAAYGTLPFTDDAVLYHWITILFVILILSIAFIVLAAFFKTRF